MKLNGIAYQSPASMISRIIVTALMTMSLIVISSPVAAIAEAASGRTDAAAADELGKGFDEAMLDITLEEACELAGIDIEMEDDVLSDDSEAGYSPNLLTSANYQRLMNYALQYKGWPYKWGGKYPSQGGFDCSGLVTWCYDNALGATMDGWMTNAARIYNDYCNYVSPSYATPGDIVFWRGTYGSDINYISHVGIYCGNNIAYAAGDPIGYCQIDKVKNIKGQPAQYFFGSLREVDDKTNYDGDGIPMYRMYNRITGEHLYTSSVLERNTLMRGDWNYEGVGWIAPKTGAPVYRLWNGYVGEHHYTTSPYERDYIVKYQGWIYEGIGWYSNGSIPVYRLYNPWWNKHHYTTSPYERDYISTHQDWIYEGIGWYGGN